MPHELLYTSAPRGLKPGASGYCTVAQTPNLPKDLAEQLEGISHYRHLRVDDPDGNPVAFAHSILTTGYTVHHVLSRIADSGLDHSGRSNFLAHHVAFDPERLPDAGPAWLCEQRLFYQKWDRGAGLLPADRAIPSGHSEPHVCRTWQKLAGDAGWGGVLAAATNAAEPAYLIYEAGQDVLPLLEEAMALLPPEARWNVTFNTYFTGKAVRTTCQWRCVTADSPEARDAIATRRGVVLRIDQPMNGVPSGPLVEAARTGHTDRPAPRRRTVEPAQPVRPIEVDELPESEPVMPASRPIRTRPPMTEPEVVDSAYDLPVPAVRRGSSGKGGTGPLILGMLLGTLLVLAATSLIEVIAGRSLLGFAGLKNADAEQAKKDKETAEAAAAEKAAELTREKARSEGLRSDRAADALALSEMTKERDKAEAKAKALQTKLDEAIAKPPVGGGGFFASLVNRAKLARLVEDLKNANAHVAKLQKELKVEKERAASPMGRIHVSSVAIPADLLPAGVIIPGLIVPHREKARIDVIGLDEPMRVSTWDANSKKARLGNDGIFVHFSIKEGGAISLDHTAPNAIRSVLQNILLRIDHGDEGDVEKRFEYVEFYMPRDGSRPRDVADANVLIAPKPKREGDVSTYRFPQSRISEKPGRLAARNARVRVGTVGYDLEVLRDPTELQNRPTTASDPSIKLKVEGKTIIVTVKSEVEPTSVSIEQLEIVRVVPGVQELKFPGWEQELVRFQKK